TRSDRDWSSDVCSSDLPEIGGSGSPAPSTIRSGGALEVADEAPEGADAPNAFGRAGSELGPAGEAPASGGTRPSPGGGVFCEFRSEERRVGEGWRSWEA